MNVRPLSFALLGTLFVIGAPAAPSQAPRSLSRAVLLDRIKGAWAGQMIGVAHGAATEFHAKGKILEGEIQPAPLANALEQDDLYVEMTFARVMDVFGLDATAEHYGEAFKKSQYNLWHANASARRNLCRGLPAALAGHPKYNQHADDIDFQIEADFIGIMCPGLPRESNKFADRIGRLMNYGDGLYGGMFVAGMYSAAFFESDPRKVVETGLACLPPGSPYARLIRDVLDWSASEPDDWRKVWQRIEEKWDKDDPCPKGALNPYNIDAKLNGGYVALGLLAGRGDWRKTIEITTRCGQDSDCNPATAAGVLGTMLGCKEIPDPCKTELEKIADRKFQFTDYSYREIVRSSEERALKLVRQLGGRVSESRVTIPVQSPKPPPLEQSDFGVPVKLLICTDPAWRWEGKWTASDRDMTATGAGAEATLSFTGTS